MISKQIRFRKIFVELPSYSRFMLETVKLALRISKEVEGCSSWNEITFLDTLHQQMLTRNLERFSIHFLNHTSVCCKKL